MSIKDPTKFTNRLIESKCNISYFNQDNDWKIGYVASDNLLTSRNIILICPGLTGFAIPFIEWFWPLHQTKHIALVSLDWRGFGLSKSNISPDTTIYPNLTINSLAGDLVTLVNNHLPKYNKLWILGHSHGVLCAIMAIQQHLSKRISGYLNIDESLMNLPQTHAADLSYPIKSTFSWDTVEKWIDDYQYQNQLGLFSKVTPALLDQFKVPGFAEDKLQLEEWMQYTHAINGNVLAFIFKQDMTSDLTSLVTTSLLNNKIPVFVYIGEGSIVPSETQKWLFNKVKNIKGSYLFSVTASNGGYHTPFLPTAKPRLQLMEKIRDFINR